MNYDPKYVFSSPGRIELLGNHTDHNHGKVLVSSINLKILSVVSPTDDETVTIYSSGFKPIIVKLNDLDIKEQEFSTSIAMVRGVLAKFKELGYKIGGFTAFCDSTIYSGAGVSSSAAFEVLVSKILSVLYNENSIRRVDLAKIAQYAETVYFNKPCGLLDQTGIAVGGVNYIDFRSTDTPFVKHIELINDDYQFIIINTGDSHSNLTPCYAEIKDDMKVIASHYNLSFLRELDPKIFFKDRKALTVKYGERIVLRAKHFFEENKRVSEAFKAIEEKDIVKFLTLLDNSGTSSYNQLKNCYVNSEDEKLPKALKYVKELDPECYSRVHGGGFAGTILMVVKKEKVETLLPELKAHFGESNVVPVYLTKFGTSLIKTFN